MSAIDQRTPKKVGITGGIGSGKSTVAKIFASLYIPVYYSDHRAKMLMNEDIHIREQVTNLFGKETFRNGILDRKVLAKMVFGNTEALQQLNDIVHPTVATDFEQWLQRYKGCSYIIKESALIFEKNDARSLDSVILVTSPLELKIKRVINRDLHRTKEDILRIMEHQLSDKEKSAKSDFIILNDEKTSLVQQVLDIDTEVRSS